MEGIGHSLLAKEKAFQEEGTARAKAERGGNQRLCVENAEWLSLCQFSYGCLKGGSCSHIPAPVPSGIDVAQKVKSQVNESAATAPGHKCFFSPSSNLSI